jgi:predicted Ser/Thr protein kinase
MTSNVIAELAAGRIGLDAAADSLRRWMEQSGNSLQNVVSIVRADAEKYSLDPSLADELLAALSTVTRRHAANATHLRAAAPAATPDLTTLRDAPRARATADENHGAPMTMLRPIPPGGAAVEFQVGSLIKGRFELKTMVGRGGMGVVFSALDRRKAEAHDPMPDVAVKILNPDFQRHPDAFVALQREASKAQTLAHPNIVTVFDFDRDGESVFITMELLRGEPLEETIRAARNRGIGRDAALPIIRGIAEGLSYAHRKGIVHSDLKPANIFLLEDGTPKILDFGIARAVPTPGNTATPDKFDAGSLGAYSEAYATEEMVEGVDPAAADDIYALGIIAYELLTGKHPFAGSTAAAARAKHLAPLPIRSLRRREWQTLARSLAFDRAARPRDAAEFLRLFFGSTRLRNVLIAAIVALAMAAGYLWYRNYQQTGPAIPFAELPVATQEQIKMDFSEGDKAWAFYKKQGIPDALTGSLTYFADAYSLHRGDRQAVRGLERAADEMLKRARGDRANLRETAHSLAETSEFLKTYSPVADALSP